VNRGTLHVLLQVLGNKYSQRFHLTLDMISDTLFLGRQAKNAKVRSQPGSYGRSFEDYFTTEDSELEDVEGHHRILRYDFGGLNMVVRIETDAYMPNTAYDLDAPIVPHPVFAAEPSPVEGIAHKGPEQTKVILGGTLVPHFLTVELKSKDKPKPLEQMWFGRTPTCFQGRHKDGLPRRADILEISEQGFVDWESKNQTILQKLV
jgi:hypothetical protein